jgi:hypothetical protein
MTNREYKHDPVLAEKAEFLMGMAGTDVDKALTCLSYALVDTVIKNSIEMVCVFRNLSEIYMSRFEEDEDADN